MTGSVCKEKSHIHRRMLSDDYYLIQLHESELQDSIRTEGSFEDMRFKNQRLFVLPIVARVAA